MLHCGTYVPFIYTHVDKYPICQKRNTLITKFLTYRCKSNKILVLDLIRPFYPNLHKNFDVKGYESCGKGPLQNTGTISQIYLEKMFFVFFEMSAFDVEFDV